MDRITFEIDGMSCGHCVAAVRKELAGVNGVAVDDVAIGSATVHYDPSLTSAERIVDAIGDAGYTVSSTRKD